MQMPSFHAIPEGSIQENCLVQTLLNLNAACYVERIALSVQKSMLLHHISSIDLWYQPTEIADHQAWSLEVYYFRYFHQNVLLKMSAPASLTSSARPWLTPVSRTPTTAEYTACTTHTHKHTCTCNVLRFEPWSPVWQGTRDTKDKHLFRWPKREHEVKPACLLFC